MARTIAGRIEQRIQKQGEGWVFAPQDFLDLGTRAAVDQALSRLAAQGTIRRIGRGLYDSPRTSALLAGPVPPSPDAIAQALARKSGSRLQSPGALAANALGLSTQVPARLVYLTDGTSRKVKVGGQTIELRHAEPRRLGQKGETVAAVIEALRHLGPGGIGEEEIARLRDVLTPREKAGLRRRRATVPTWLLPILDAITRTEAA